MDFTKSIEEYLQLEIETIRKLDVAALDRAVNALLEARERGGTVYTMGNGGSAATASHMVCDLAKGTYEAIGGKKFRVECLCDNTPIMMAISNDIGYENVFVYQLRERLKPEDLVIGISGSGNSENVVRALRYAKELGTPILGITGYSGGKVKELADYSMHVPIDDMQITEDIHMIFDHMILRVLEESKKWSL